jgi:hypothetical protein
MSTIEKVLTGITGLAVIGTIFTSKYSTSILGTSLNGYSKLIKTAQGRG